MDNCCFICAEDYNRNEHKKVSCPYCSFDACRTCCQTYILDQDANVCMNPEKNAEGQPVCNRPWTRKFIVDNFPDAWIKGNWRNMNEKVGFEREKALLPATMSILLRKKEEAKVQEQIDIIDRKIRELYSQRGELHRSLHQTNNNQVPERVSRGRPCPDENCRGFLSTQWRCGVCDMWTCPDCHQIKGMSRDADHTCNPDDVATATLLNRDTRPCPSCATPIHKIMGCDQMWCTQCHTGFSWRTGAIQNRVHNPHFFEWQRNNNGGVAPRRPGDIECGRDLGDSRALMSIRRNLRRITNSTVITRIEKSIELYVRGTIHLDHVQSNRFRNDNVVNNQDIRLAYLEKKISEKKFKSDIIRRDKAYEKKQDIYNVLQLQIRAVTDIIYRYESALHEVSRGTEVNSPQLEESIKSTSVTYLQEIQNITNYCNKLLEEHSKTYGCKKYQLDYANRHGGGGGRTNDILI